jgi:hypothetical protein
MAMDTYIKMEELFDAVFSIQSVMRLYACTHAQTHSGNYQEKLVRRRKMTFMDLGVGVSG